jgi:tRNA A37 methylthiotransferase MiaB
MKGTVCIALASACPRAEADICTLFSYFRINGWEIVSAIRQADLVVFSGCVVASAVEDRSVKLLTLASRRMKPGARLVIVGCCPATSLFSALGDLSVRPLCITPGNIGELDRIVASDGVKFWDMPEPNELGEPVSMATSVFGSLDRKRARFYARRHAPLPSVGDWLSSRLDAVPCDPQGDAKMFSIRVAWGCMGDCSYCGIRLGMGPFRSKPLDAIERELQAGLAKGYRRFQTVAADLGAYGQDCGSSAANLFRAILGKREHYRMGMVDLNVAWMIRQPETVEAMGAAREKVERLQVPVQSGSDRILQLMRRGHRAAPAIGALNALAKACPNARRSTHVVVGFPGETEDDFAQSVDLISRTPGWRVNVYAYSDRPGTDAADMPDKIPDQVKFRRMHRLKRLFPGRCRDMV